jgi:hypothetical protein
MSSARKKWIALGLLAILAGLAWWTMQPGKIRLVVFVLIGSFALRIVLAASGSRYDRGKQG